MFFTKQRGIIYFSRNKRVSAPASAFFPYFDTLEFCNRPIAIRHLASLIEQTDNWWLDIILACLWVAVDDNNWLRCQWNWESIRKYTVILIVQWIVVLLLSFLGVVGSILTTGKGLCDEHKCFSVSEWFSILLQVF